MFGKLKEKLTGAGQRMAGRTDLLEAACAGAALMAAADGSIDDSEVSAAIDAVKTNETMAAAFNESQIATTMDRMLTKANGSFTGRAALKKELGDIPKEDGETVFLVAMDVAFADGDFDETERKMAQEIAGIFGLNLNSYV